MSTNEQDFLFGVLIGSIGGVISGAYLPTSFTIAWIVSIFVLFLFSRKR